ncbi:MAG: PEP/pyruvate-binding domain-containing protein [Bacillota bacterium]
MGKDSSNVLWLHELGKDDPMIAGKKCCHLGEMLQAKLPVPPGFALTLKAYETFLQGSGSKETILRILEKHKQELLINVGKFEEISSYIINDVILNKEMPGELKEDIALYYDQLCNTCGCPDTPVAVRSSGPVSMPGQFDTFLNVCGYNSLLNNIVKVWASSFNARAMAYRLQRGLVLESSPIGVAVLKMVNARCSGVMFTLDPVNGDPSRIFIEGSWGLGESLVSGQVTPDKFVLDKVTFDITQRTICNKVVELVRGPQGDVIARDVPVEKQKTACLSDEEILELARIGKHIEKHYGVAQDIEWAIDNDLSFPHNIIILQTRQESIWSKKTKAPVAPKGSATELIARGLMQGIRI